MVALKGWQLSCLPEVAPRWLQNPEPFGSGGDGRLPSPAKMALEPPETGLNAFTIVPTVQRRHSAKGEAVGWIKTRMGNTQRKNPCTSYFYCWDEPMRKDGPVSYRRHQVYVPKRVLPMVQQMIDQRQPMESVLKVIAGAKRPKR